MEVKPYYERNGQTIYLGDCLEVMKTFPDKSFDLVLTDPPYGTTSNEWDTVVDFFDEAMRITRTGVVVFASQPFTSDDTKITPDEWSRLVPLKDEA